LVKKEYCATIRTSKNLKLAKAAREGGSDKFIFFESDEQAGRDFHTAYNLHMRLDVLSKAIAYYDMDDVFKILPSKMVQLLENKLDARFLV